MSPQIIVQPGDPHGSDHACLCFEIPYKDKYAFVKLPNRNLSKMISTLIEQGTSLQDSIEQAKRIHPEDMTIEKSKRAADDAEL